MLRTARNKNNIAWTLKQFNWLPFFWPIRELHSRIDFVKPCYCFISLFPTEAFWYFYHINLNLTLTRVVHMSVQDVLVSLLVPVLVMPKHLIIINLVKEPLRDSGLVYWHPQLLFINLDKKSIY